MKKKILIAFITISILALLVTPTLATNTPIQPTTQDNFQATELIIDGGFEGCNPAAAPNACPDWGETSTNFGTPICDAGFCGTGGGTAGPNGGAVWAWFGGAGTFENGTVSQSVTIPAGSAVLSFYWWVGTGGAAGDYFNVDIDGNSIFNVSGTALASGPQTAGYVQESIDVSAYADGGSHTVTFTGNEAGPTVNINLDDVSLIHTPVAGGGGAPLVAYDKINQVRVTAPGSPLYESAGGNVVRDAGGNEIWVPNATAHNPYEDVYDVTDSVEIDGTTWVEIFIGNAVDFVWLPVGPNVQLIY